MSSRLAVVVVALVVLGACGSTVPRAQMQAESGLSGGSAGSGGRPSGASNGRADGGAGPDGAFGSGRPVSGAAASSSGDGATAVDDRPDAADGGANPAAGGAGGRLPVAPGVRGVTDTTIELGMVTSSPQAVGTVVGGATGNADFGEGSSFDYDAVNTAAVDLVNATGGIAGREVKPIYFFYNPGNFFSPSSRQQENQRACSTWTEDNHVFAMYTGAMSEEIILQCAASTKTPMVHVRYGIFPSQRRFDSMADYWYGPHWFVADRRERALATFLDGQGFFGKGAKVALMVENKADIREGVERGMKPALADAGIKPVTEIVYPDQVESPWQTYVLQLQSEGVTHVLWSGMTTPGFAALMMMRAAEDQGYRPKWGIGSDAVPQAQITFGAPRNQLENVMAMGWRPWYDVGDGEPRSELGRSCAEQMKKYGQDAQQEAYSYEVCEFLFFLQVAFKRADVVSAAGLAGGVARLGDSYGSTITVNGATRFGPGRHYGPVLARAVAYDRAKDTMIYTSEPVPLAE